MNTSPLFDDMIVTEIVQLVNKELSQLSLIIGISTALFHLLPANRYDKANEIGYIFIALHGHQINRHGKR